MSEHSIRTLFGEEPTIKNDKSFVMGNPLHKCWTTVVQIEEEGQVISRQEVPDQALIEAIDKANELRQGYRNAGLTENEGRFIDQVKGQNIFVFVM